jgi:cobalt-zinc-cadmium resistance protein CzcA
MEARTMIRLPIAWSLGNPLIVPLCIAALAGFGGHSFPTLSIEAYPNPAPAIIEMVAQYPSANAEDVERQVTVPLEVTLAGMPGMKSARRKLLAGLAHQRNQFEYRVNHKEALQEVNCLRSVLASPTSVNPHISPRFRGMAKRFELRPDPSHAPTKSLTLALRQSALANSNLNAGADVLFHGPNAITIRGVGMFGLGLDPVEAGLIRVSPPVTHARRMPSG